MLTLAEAAGVVGVDTREVVDLIATDAVASFRRGAAPAQPGCANASPAGGRTGASSPDGRKVRSAAPAPAKIRAV